MRVAADVQARVGGRGVPKQIVANQTHRVKTRGDPDIAEKSRRHDHELQAIAKHANKKEIRDL